MIFFNPALYGIAGNTQNWIRSFLSNCKQRVSVNRALLDITDVTSSVFLQMTYIIKFLQKIHEILQTYLNELQTWSDKWQMEFNVSKCVHLPITKLNPTHTSTVLAFSPTTFYSIQPVISRSKIRFQINLDKLCYSYSFKIFENFRHD